MQNETKNVTLNKMTLSRMTRKRTPKGMTLAQNDAHVRMKLAKWHSENGSKMIPSRMDLSRMTLGIMTMPNETQHNDPQMPIE